MSSNYTNFSEKLKKTAAMSKVKSMLPKKDYAMETEEKPAMRRGTPSLSDPSMNRGTPKLDVDTGEDIQMDLKKKLKKIKNSTYK